MSDWHDAERHAELAHQFFEKGQWEKALRELELALAVHPEQIDWRYGMGLTLQAMDRHEDAIECFRAVLQQRGEDVELLQHLAGSYIQTEQWRPAADALERIVRIDPECEQAHCQAILVHGRLGDHDAAEVQFYLARQLVDECPWCYDHLAQSLAMRRQWDRAIWCWRRAAEISPQHPDVMLHLGQALAETGQIDQAQQCLVDHLRQQPGDVEAWLDLGQLLLSVGRHAQAAEKLRRALELDPQCAEAALLPGELELPAGHVDAAATRLQRAHRLDPDLPGVQLALAEVARRRGLVHAAVAHLRVELQRPDRSPRHTLEAARLLLDLRQPALARQTASEMLDSLRPMADSATHAGALICRGVAALQMGQVEGGQRDLRLALRVSPGNLSALRNLALACFEQRRWRRAACWLAQAMRLTPDDPQLLRLAQKLRWRLLGQRLGRSLRRIARAGR